MNGTYEDIIEFNRWRERYDSLSDEEQLEFYNTIEKYYPEQKSFTLSNYDYLFSLFQGKNVIEIGGWKGELAKYCLEKYDIKSWTNFELCTGAIEKTVCKDERYKVFPVSFRFWRNMEFGEGIVLASHVIEHLSDKDFLEFAKKVKDNILCFEAPISIKENNWSNYYGTHILKMGWDSIDELFKNKERILIKDGRIYK